MPTPIVLSSSAVIYAAQTKILELAELISASNSLRRVREEILLSEALLRYIRALDADTSLTFAESQRICQAMITLGELFNFPVSPSITSIPQNITIGQPGAGPQGPVGPAGPSGSLDTLTNGTILVGDVSNEPVERTVSGDFTISNTGVGAIVSGVIVNADINAAAAVAYSKLNLSGSIINADVNASAAITYSKLNLSGGIVNADVNASAAIAYSKLALSGGIVNGDINASAAIAYSKLNLASSIVNADVAAAAAITRTKLASGSNNRLIVNNSSGIMQDHSALTSSRVLVTNASGLPVAATTTTAQVNYLSTTTSDVQVQLDAKITGTVTGAAEGDILYHNGATFVNLPRGTNGQALYSTATSIQWDTPTINGIPVGGSTGQVLAKVSGTDFDADWQDFTLSLITDITASAAEVNVLTGLTADTTELNYTDGVTSPIQAQLDNKQSSTLPQNAIWIGNSSNIATTLSAGTNGYVLTSVSGVPTWQPVAAGTAPGSDTLLVFNDAGSFGTDAGFSYNKTTNILSVEGLELGTGLAGASRTIQAAGSATNVSLILAAKGNEGITINAGSTGGFIFGNSYSNPADFRTTSSATNSVIPALLVEAVSSGSPANGIGTSLQFGVHTGVANQEVGAIIEAVTTDITSTSEDIDLIFKTMSAGASAGERLRITSDGRIYGKGLHNSAGAITGTTNQYIASGTYTPTSTNTANISVSTPEVAQYIRVGNVVTVSGIISIDSVTSGIPSALTLTLPIASNLANSRDLAGVVSGSGGYGTGPIAGDTVTDQASFNVVPTATTLGAYSYTFTYLIL